MKRKLDENDDNKPERKRPAFASVIVEALRVDRLQKLCSYLEPILRQVVSEEVERALAKVAPARLIGSSRYSLQRIGGSDGRNLQLHFKSKLSLPLFSGGRVEGEQGAAIHVVLIDANTGCLVTFGPEASMKLEVVALGGDFNNEDDEDWSQEEFEIHVVKEREGRRPLLTGDLYVVLKEGVGTLGEVTFTDNSCWIRSRKFRLGLKVASGYCNGIRVREAKTEAFTVKDHRGELYKKHYPPALNDEVWRLEKIGKDGVFHKKLRAAGIVNVEGFLRNLVRDSANLRAILGSGMSNKAWGVLVEHAKTCVLNGKLYIYYPEDSRTRVGVVFNNIYELSGLISEDQYLSADSLSDTQKVYVDGLVKKAYENWNQIIEYEEGTPLINFHQPERLDISQAGHLTAPENYSTTVATDYPVQVTELPSAQFSSVLQQDQFMGIHQHQTGQSATGGYQDIEYSVHQAKFNHFEDWLNHQRSHEILQNDDDMEQLLPFFSMGGNEEGDGFAFPSFTHDTPMMQQGYEEEDHGRSGKAVVGWLKIKAAMRWGFIIRRKAAERRAQIVELEDDE